MLLVKLGTRCSEIAQSCLDEIAPNTNTVEFQAQLESTLKCKHRLEQYLRLQQEGLFKKQTINEKIPFEGDQISAPNDPSEESKSNDSNYSVHDIKQALTRPRRIKRDVFAQLTQEQAEVVIKRPKSPIPPFVLFYNGKGKEIAAKRKTLNGRNGLQATADVWRRMNAEEKEPYMQEAWVLREKFNADLQAYNRTHKDTYEAVKRKIDILRAKANESRTQG